MDNLVEKIYCINKKQLLADEEKELSKLMSDLAARHAINSGGLISGAFKIYDLTAFNETIATAVQALKREK